MIEFKYNTVDVIIEGISIGTLYYTIHDKCWAFHPTDTSLTADELRAIANQIDLLNELIKEGE